jgi:hypothetical protein
MSERKQLELYVLRVVPHPLRDDSMTIGVVVMQPDSKASEDGNKNSQEDWFADARFTRDWERLGCFAPEVEREQIERLETTLRARMRDIGSREDLLQLIDENFGTVFDVGPAKGLVTFDPAAEMRILEHDYLDRMPAPEKARGLGRLGRWGIVSRMQDAFAEAGVLEMVERDLDMREFTGNHDPFSIDFGYRVGNSVKMFQALAINMSREPAVTLSYRYTRIRDGMRMNGDDALLTAVISEEAMRANRDVASGIEMLRACEVRVRGVEELAEIAEGVRGELMGRQ